MKEFVNYSLVLSQEYSNYLWQILGNDYNTLEWNINNNISKPTKEELDNKFQKSLSKFKKQNCKDQAKQLIASSDWSVLPDVNITNKSEFESYRTQLRNLILNPVEDPIFPVEPNPIWSK
jgi:hypothetical protein